MTDLTGSGRPDAVSGAARRRRAAVVTGGGGGIGTAVALELARRGVAVVAMDPGVGVQGEPLDEPTAAQTARLITAEGGVARASTASVTDRAAVRSLFAGVVAEFGSLDIVVNTAGILRFAPFLQASEDDWRAVLGVHLDGYLNVLAEAVPLMQAAGYGRIVGVTSGAGLARAAADNASYSSAKRAVAAVTWQLAGLLPDGVALNALSPLAATRMITSALSGSGGRSADQTRAGGLDLSGMPAAQDMAPAAAYLASEEAAAFRGQIIFSAGPELSVISPPQLIEAVRTERTADFAASLDTLVPVVMGPAEAGQRSTGGANARFGAIFDRPGTTGPVAGAESPPRYCLVISDNAALARSLAPALARCGLTAIDAAAGLVSQWPAAGPPDRLPAGFAAADQAVTRAAHVTEGIDAVVIAPGAFAGASGAGHAVLAGAAGRLLIGHRVRAVARGVAAGRGAAGGAHLAAAAHRAPGRRHVRAAARRGAGGRAAGALCHPGSARADRRVLRRPRDRRTCRSRAGGPAHRPPAVVRRRHCAARCGTVRALGLDRPSRSSRSAGHRLVRDPGPAGLDRGLAAGVCSAVRRTAPINSPLTKYLSLYDTPVAGL